MNRNTLRTIALVLVGTAVLVTLMTYKKQKKNLYAIYENHDARQASNRQSHMLLEDNPGEYAVFCEGIQNDFTDGQQMVFGVSKVTLYKEDPRWRFNRPDFLKYMYDSSSDKSHSRDMDSVVAWVSTHCPNITIFSDQLLSDNKQAVQAKKLFNQTFRDTAALARLRNAYVISTHFENQVIKKVADYDNVQLILGVAHARVTMMLCKHKGFRLVGVYHPAIDDQTYAFYMNAVLAKYLVLPDSVYNSIL
jgi:hypothetical protein